MIRLSLLLLLATAAAAGEPATRVYIVQLREPGALAARSMTPGRVARLDARSAALRDDGARLTASHDQLLQALGAPKAKLYSYRLTFNGFAARLSPEQAARLRRDPRVRSVHEDRVKALRTNSSPSFLGLLDSSAGLQAARGLKGENVVIGVIDSGIAPGHPSFSDQEPKPAPRLCRSDWGKGSLLGKWLCARFKKPRLHSAYAAPAGWRGACAVGPGFRAADCNRKLIGARFYPAGFDAFYGAMDENEFRSPHDADGHGTHIASIAAGNRVQASLGGIGIATVSGMAPRARIAVYKACWLEPGESRASCAMSDLAAAIEDAVADGVDIISYSVGKADGGPTDDDALALLGATDAGVLAVVAAGNEGPDPGTVESPGTAPWVLTVAASSRTGPRYDHVLRVTAPASAAGDYTAKEAAFTRALRSGGPVTGRLVLADDGTSSGEDGTPADACEELLNASALRGNIALIRRGLCKFPEKIARVEAAGAIAAVVYDDVPGAPIVMTSDRGPAGVPGLMIAQEDGEHLVERLKAGDAVQAHLDATLIVTRADPGNRIYERSGRGPNAVLADILKPDVTAPGVDILAAQTPDVANGVRGERFQYLTGTSMAVPHVAGIAALLRQAHPDWSPAAIRSALVTTARQNLLKEDGATAADAFDFGGGHIVPNLAVDPGLVYEAGAQDYAAYDGTGNSADELNLPTIAVSSVVRERTVRRRVTNIGPPATYSASVHAPPGLEVSVVPDSLTLAAEASGEFSVTLRNTGDPARLETWSEGDLTWASGARRVRSPIVARPAPFAAPAIVSATGASGPATFAVEFGYSGTYEARATGLVAPTRLRGYVIDDPADQYTVYADDSAVPDTIRRFHVTVPAGTRYLRVVTASADAGAQDDIDLYLVCPGGQCPGGAPVLASNGAGSDEVVGILDPAPGDYLVDVHGYDTDEVVGGPGANFELAVWMLAESGGAGSFAIESAPAEAAPLTTGDVVLGWHDLAAGEVYLGLVTHGDGNRTLGYTLVEVLTP